jgi:replicative DNA helicase
MNSGHSAGGSPLNEPRMTIDEVEKLVIHVLRSPVVYSEARQLVRFEDWTADERHYSIVVDACFKLRDSKQYAAGEVSYAALYGAVSSALFEDPLLKTNAAVIDDVLGQLTDSKPINGLLYHAHHLAEADLDATYGLELLKRFLYERQVFDVTQKLISGAAGRVIKDFDKQMAQGVARAAEIEAIGQDEACDLPGLGPQTDAELEAGWGKSLSGLRTGIEDLDKHTGGLRGVLVLGAMPNAGKTSMAVHVAAGVASHHEENDAVVVFLTFDMRKSRIAIKLLSHFCDLDWSTLKYGSPEFRGQHTGPYFNAGDFAKLQAGKAARDGEIGRRIRVYDRKSLPGAIDARRLVSLLAKAKAETGAKRALLVIDYLQLLEPPAAIQEQGDLACDKWRIQVMADVVELTVSDADPEGAAVLVISEARKPPDSKQLWGGNLADISGAGRITYAADAAILYRAMNLKEIRLTYGLEGASTSQVAQRLAQLDAAGTSPMIVVMAKARDGMKRGEWPAEFWYQRSQWRKPPNAPAASGGMYAGITDGDDDDDDAAHAAAITLPSVRERMLAALAKFPAGETMTALSKAAGMAGGRTRKILEAMVKDGIVALVLLDKLNAKSKKPYFGYKLVAVEGQANGNGSTHE